MYRIKEDTIAKIRRITAAYYCNILGITPQYMSNVLTGRTAAKETLAKSIISLAYDITLDDEQMTELLEKHFTKEK